MFELFYHPIYTDGIDERSRFPKERYKLTKKILDNSNFDIEFLEPEMANIEDIYVAHERKYVDSFIAGRLSNKEKREIGLQPWNDQIVDRTRYIMGGSLGALKSAINSNGIAGNMAGGTHHAYHSKGSGYCIFNDLAICAKVAKRDYEKINNILIIDLDVHQGDGTAVVFQDDPSVFTLSVHGASNYPFRKPPSDLDVPLPKGTGDQGYLDALSFGVVGAYCYHALKQMSEGVGRTVPMMVMSHQYLLSEEIPEIEAWTREVGHKLPLLRDVDVSYYLRQEKAQD